MSDVLRKKIRFLAFFVGLELPQIFNCFFASFGPQLLGATANLRAETGKKTMKTLGQPLAKELKKQERGFSWRDLTSRA